MLPCLVPLDFGLLLIPTSPDAGDDLMIDCAMNAGAMVVTFNIRDFQSAKESLGLRVLTPVQLLGVLASGDKS
jgi:hypothetical protein